MTKHFHKPFFTLHRMKKFTFKPCRLIFYCVIQRFSLSPHPKAAHVLTHDRKWFCSTPSTTCRTMRVIIDLRMLTTHLWKAVREISLATETIFPAHYIPCTCDDRLLLDLLAWDPMACVLPDSFSPDILHKMIPTVDPSNLTVELSPPFVHHVVFSSSTIPFFRRTKATNVQYSTQLLLNNFI